MAAAPGPHAASAAVALAARVQHLSAGRLAASASRTWSGPATTSSSAEPPGGRGRSRRRPARSSCSPPPWRRPGLDPLPAYDAAEPRAPARGHGQALSRSSSSPATARRATTTRASAISPGRSRSRPIRGSPCIPTPRAPWASSDGAWVHLEVARGKGTCRLRVKLTDATPPDVVNTGMGWWLPSDPAPEHGALDVNINAALRLRRPLGPGLRLLRRARPAVPGGVGGGLTWSATAAFVSDVAEPMPVGGAQHHHQRERDHGQDQAGAHEVARLRRSRCRRPPCSAARSPPG